MRPNNFGISSPVGILPYRRVFWGWNRGQNKLLYEYKTNQSNIGVFIQVQLSGVPSQPYQEGDFHPPKADLIAHDAHLGGERTLRAESIATYPRRRGRIFPPLPLDKGLLSILSCKLSIFLLLLMLSPSNEIFSFHFILFHFFIFVLLQKIILFLFTPRK